MGERAQKFNASALVPKRNVHATQVAFTIFIILHSMQVRGGTLRNGHVTIVAGGVVPEFADVIGKQRLQASRYYFSI